MLSRNIKKLITTFMVIAVVWLIIMDPLNITLHGKGIIYDITTQINGFIHSIHFDYSFPEISIRSGFIFIQYIVLGAVLMMMEVSYTDNVVRDLFAPLFLGLAIPVGIGYCNILYKGGSKGDIVSIVTAFWGVSCGIAAFLVIYFMSSKNRNIKGKVQNSKCKRR